MKHEQDSVEISTGVSPSLEEEEKKRLANLNHSPSNGASAFSGSINTTSGEEEEEDKKRRKKFNINATSYIPLKFVAVDSKDSTLAKEYVIQDHAGVEYAKEQKTDEGFKYENIKFNQEGPLEIKIPCSFKMVDGKKEFSKECDVLYFDNQGKLVGYEKGNSKETQLNKGWLKGKLGDGLGLTKEDQEQAMNPGYSKSNFVQQPSSSMSSSISQNTPTEDKQNSIKEKNINNNEELKKLKEENERLKNENTKLKEENTKLREENERLRMSLEDKDNQIMKLTEKVNLYNKHETKIKEFEEAERIRIERENFINENIQKTFSELITIYKKTGNEEAGLENDKQLIKKIIDDRYEALKKIKDKPAEDRASLEGNAKNIYNSINKKEGKFDENLKAALVEAWKGRLELEGIKSTNSIDQAMKIRYLEKIEKQNKEESPSTSKAEEKATETPKKNSSSISIAAFLDKASNEKPDLHNLYTQVKTNAQYAALIKNKNILYTAEEIKSLDATTGIGDVNNTKMLLENVNSITLIFDQYSEKDDDTENAKKTKASEIIEITVNKQNQFISKNNEKIEEINDKITKLRGQKKEKSLDDSLKAENNNVSNSNEEIKKLENELKLVETNNKSASLYFNNAFEKLLTYTELSKEDGQYKISGKVLTNLTQNQQNIIDQEIDKRIREAKFEFTNEKPEKIKNDKIQLYTVNENGKRFLKIYPSGEKIDVNIPNISKLRKNKLKEVDQLYIKAIENRLKSSRNWSKDTINEYENTKIEGKKYLFYLLDQYKPQATSKVDKENNDKIKEILDKKLKEDKVNPADYRDLNGESLIGAMIRKLPDDELKKISLENIPKDHLVNNEDVNIVQYAIKHKKTDFVEEIIGQEFNLNIKDKKGNNPLLVAIEEGELDLVNKLLEKKEVKVPESIIADAINRNAKIEIIDKLVENNYEFTEEAWKGAIDKKYDLRELVKLRFSTKDINLVTQNKNTLIAELINESETQKKIIITLVENGLELTNEEKEQLPENFKAELKNAEVKSNKNREIIKQKLDNFLSSETTQTSFEYKDIPTNIDNQPAIKYLLLNHIGEGKEDRKAKVYDFINSLVENKHNIGIDGLIVLEKNISEVIKYKPELAIRVLNSGKKITGKSIEETTDKMKLYDIVFGCDEKTRTRLLKDNKIVSVLINANEVDSEKKLSILTSLEDENFKKIIKDSDEHKKKTLLETAIKQENIQLAKKLIESGADPKDAMQEVISYLIKNRANNSEVNDFVKLLHEKIVPEKDRPEKDAKKHKDDFDIGSDRWPPKDIAEQVKNIIFSGSKSKIASEFTIINKNKDPKKSREI